MSSLSSPSKSPKVAPAMPDDAPASASTSTASSACPVAGADGLLMRAARDRCPAFAGGCPFSAATTSTALKETLETMPLSHTDPASDTAGLIEVVVRRTRGRSDSGENVFFASDGEETEALVGEFVGWWAAALAGKAPETPGAPCVGLADRLKRGTEAAHAEAENVAFVQLLLGGKAPLEGYVCLVAALRRIYGALEAAADARSDAGPVRAVSEGRADALRRAAALDADLAYYRRRDAALVGRAEAFALRSLATNSYVEHLDQLGDGSKTTAAGAEALVAHLYTRYLGDLSGGQILRRAVVRAYGLAPESGTTLDAGEGVAFYDFPLIGKPTKLRRFKDAYRTVLDDLDVADPDAVVAEAVDAFRRNTALLKELDVVLLGADAAERAHARAPAKKAPDSPPQCPFLAREGGAALAAKYGNVCPFTGAPADDAKLVRAGTGGGCPFAAFQARDFALVACLFLALSLATHVLTPAAA